MSKSIEKRYEIKEVLYVPELKKSFNTIEETEVALAKHDLLEFVTNSIFVEESYEDVDYSLLIDWLIQDKEFLLKLLSNKHLTNKK